MKQTQNNSKFYYRAKSQITNLFSGAVLAQGNATTGVTGSPLFDKLRREFPATGLSGSQTVGALVLQVVQILLLVAGSLAVIFIVIGGIQYVLSRGNEEAAEKSKKTIVAAVWGLVIIIMAFAIVFIISNALISGTGGLGIPTN
jgi:hypothetical protein